MGLVTRSSKGSKLTITEMDGNLTYLDAEAKKEKSSWEADGDSGIKPKDDKTVDASHISGLEPYIDSEWELIEGEEYDDWFVPSSSEASLIAVIADKYDADTLVAGLWTSSQSTFNSEQGLYLEIFEGSASVGSRAKTNTYPYLPIRMFTVSSYDKSIGDEGEGGWVLYKEAVGSDVRVFIAAKEIKTGPYIWGPTESITTETAIGSGEQNTANILASISTETEVTVQDLRVIDGEILLEPKDKSALVEKKWISDLDESLWEADGGTYSIKPRDGKTVDASHISGLEPFMDSLWEIDELSGDLKPKDDKTVDASHIANLPNTLEELTDTVITSPQEGDLLQYKASFGILNIGIEDKVLEYSKNGIVNIGAADGLRDQRHLYYTSNSDITVVFYDGSPEERYIGVYNGASVSEIDTGSNQVTTRGHLSYDNRLLINRRPSISMSMRYIDLYDNWDGENFTNNSNIFDSLDIDGKNIDDLQPLFIGNDIYAVAIAGGDVYTGKCIDPEDPKKEWDWYNTGVSADIISPNIRGNIVGVVTRDSAYKITINGDGTATVSDNYIDLITDVEGCYAIDFKNDLIYVLTTEEVGVAYPSTVSVFDDSDVLINSIIFTDCEYAMHLTVTDKIYILGFDATYSDLELWSSSLNGGDIKRESTSVVVMGFFGVLASHYETNDYWVNIDKDDISKWEADGSTGIKPKDGKTVDASHIDGLPEGLEGTNYVYVAGDGTPTENGTELLSVYSDVKVAPFLSADNVMTIVIGPGLYKFGSEFVLDTEYVNIVSLTGNPDVILQLDGIGNISVLNITCSNIFVKGISVGTIRKITIQTGIECVCENCIGGDGSFSADELPGTFINCVGGAGSFANSSSSIMSGKLINCRLTEGEFGIPKSGGLMRFCLDYDYTIINKDSYYLLTINLTGGESLEGTVRILEAAEPVEGQEVFDETISINENSVQSYVPRDTGYSITITATGFNTRSESLSMERTNIITSYELTPTPAGVTVTISTGVNSSSIEIFNNAEYTGEVTYSGSADDEGNLDIVSPAWESGVYYVRVSAEGYVTNDSSFEYSGVSLVHIVEMTPLPE
jgi:hypothetical protein